MKGKAMGEGQTPVGCEPRRRHSSLPVPQGLCALLGLVGMLCSPWAVAQAGLDSLIARTLPAGSHVGISAYDLTADQPLIDYQGDRLCRPASTMKLLTAITALSTGAADRPLRTELWARGTLQGDTLVGDLIVVGGMDTELTEQSLDSMARTVARWPVRVVTGRLLGDVSLRDSIYWGRGWAWDDAPDAFQPYLSPLMLCRGVVTVDVNPGNKGDTAEVCVSPASTFYTIDNRSRSRTPAAGPLTISRDWMTLGNHILVHGNVDRRSSTQLSVYPSQDFFLHTFAERLQQAGVCIDAGYAYEEFQPTATSTLVMAYETPMQDLLEQMLKESDNLCAEALLTLLGYHTTGHRHVSAKDGLKAVEQIMKSMGHDPHDYKLADGCGLSPYNYLSPSLLVDFLRYAFARPDVYRRLLAALPVGGIDGTLKYRMRSGTPSFRRVHAKTGSVTGIYCLAGYLRTAAGHTVAFAIMNQNVLSGRQARQMQDEICDLLVESQW